MFANNHFLCFIIYSNAMPRSRAKCIDLQIYLRQLLRISSLLDKSTALQIFCGISNGQVPPKDKFQVDRMRFNAIRSRLIVYYNDINEQDDDQDDDQDDSSGSDFTC